MIKTLLTILIIIFLIPKVQCKTIRVGVLEYPPHIYKLNGRLTGPALTYMKNALNKNYTEIEFYYFPNKRGLMELNKGNIDILFPVTKDKGPQSYLTRALFHSVPGMCFKKIDFIPLLSSTRLFDNKTIGVPAGVDVVSSLINSKADIRSIVGSDAISRGISLLLRDRIDGFYHPSPIKIYHYTNPLSKKIACSYFYGYSTEVLIAIGPKMHKNDSSLIEKLYSDSIKESSYEYYFAKHNPIK
jgi:hypothetical protein